jgi:hypothetical protein
MIICGVLLSTKVISYYGFFIGVLSFPVGCVLFVLSLRLFLFFSDKYLNYWRTFFPKLPNCHNDLCGSNDYKKISCDNEGSTHVCQCGNQYRWIDDHYYQITESGECKPYMKKKGFSWVVDEGTAHQKET